MKELLVVIYASKTGAFVTSYQHPFTKKRVRENFKSREEAKAHKQAIENKFTKKQFNNLMGLNIAELINMFMIDVPNNNLAKYTKLHLADFIEIFGEFLVEDLTSDVLKAWLDQIQIERNLKYISLRKIKCDLDGFFKYLIEKEIISNSPLTEIYYAKTIPTVASRNILLKNDINNILESVKEFSPGYLYPLIKIFIETGAKNTEVMDLKWTELDIENKKVKFEKTSSSCERILPISDELASILNRRKNKSGYVFVNIHGEQFTTGRIARAITEYRVRSRHPKKWTVSDFRHSFAINFLLKEGSLKNLQYILGHHNVYQTKQLYGEIKKGNFSKR